MIKKAIFFEKAVIIFSKKSQKAKKGIRKRQTIKIENQMLTIVHVSVIIFKYSLNFTRIYRGRTF